MAEFPHLMAPGRIGALALRNRIVMSPMGSNLAEPDGHLGERIIRYYEERARGGVGLVIVGVGAVAFPAGACIPNQVAVSDDAFLPGLARLAERVHAHGAKIAIQLQHAGKVATRDIVAGRPLWVPSVTPYKAGDLMTELTPEELQAVTGDYRRPGAKFGFHEMDASDIEVVIEQFAAAADRVRRAGFDGVEIHAGHGYLLSAFLSPATNQREDEYGGPIENRARLMLEVIRAVKSRLGERHPVWCRLDAKEYRTPGGIGEEDGARAAELAAEAGADAIHVSAYADATSGVAFTDAPLVHQPAGYVGFAEGIKKRVGVPVIAVGRIEPDRGEALVANGGADFIAMARKLLADPELPSKLAAGRAADVRPCIYCYRCVGSIFLNEPTRCAANPATAREDELAIEPAPTAKRVLVVGGGPAGLEAARIAALRGHQVTLCERDAVLGGTLGFSALVYPPNGLLAEWLERQVRALPIDVRVGCEVAPDFVASLDPEVVLVAVGARRELPAIPGADRHEVWSGDALRTLLAGGGQEEAGPRLSAVQRLIMRTGRRLGLARRRDLARNLSRWWMPLGKRIVILGGGLVGLELAEFLCERGRSVAVVDEGSVFGAEMAPPRRWRVLHELREHGVAMHPGVRTQRIDDAGVHLANSDGDGQVLPADAVVLAVGTVANPGLAESLGTGREIHTLGDCNGVGYIEGALLDATRIARAI
jgi:2,4-dienoyl-CoA reductase-like NADH-dependent reductase (Old Yellow Enzyme family)